MLENSEDPWTERAGPAGVEEEEEADEQEEEESGPAATLWPTGGFFRPWRITTNVSKPRAALMTSCRVKDGNKKKKEKIRFDILIAEYEERRGKTSTTKKHSHIRRPIKGKIKDNYSN